MANQNVSIGCASKLDLAIGQEPGGETSSNSSSETWVPSSVGVDCTTKLDLPVGQESEETPSNFLSETCVHSRGSLVRQGDQVGTLGQAIQESLEHEDLSQSTASEEDNTDLLSVPFARKLWNLVQNQAFQSMKWSDNGDSIIIEGDLFQREILHHRDAEKIFVKESLKSFIHQLKSCGFRKIHSQDSALNSGDYRKMMMYGNSNFQRDKPELLDNIGRDQLRNLALSSEAQSPVTRAAEQGPSPKKVKLVPTRSSPQLHKTEGDEEKSQQGIPKNLTPEDNLYSGPSSACENNSIPVSAPDNSPPQEIHGPHGQGTSGNDIASPLAIVKTEGAGYGPSSSSVNLKCRNIMSMYNICYSLLKAAFSSVSLTEYAEEEEEQEWKQENKAEEEEEQEEDKVVEKEEEEEEEE